MRVFTYIGNVVTGRFAHWNDANNQTIAEMWERSQHFPEHIKIPFQDFIICCTLLMDDLLGPDKGRQRLIKKDPLRITRQQFVRIQAIMLEAFSGMFLQLNPSFSDSFKGALAILTGRNPDQSRIILLTERTDEPDLIAISCAAWEEVVAIAESSQGTTALDAYPFTILLGTLAAQSFEEVNRKLICYSRSLTCNANQTNKDPK